MAFVSSIQLVPELVGVSLMLTHDLVNGGGLVESRSGRKRAGRGRFAGVAPETCEIRLMLSATGADGADVALQPDGVEAWSDYGDESVVTDTQEQISEQFDTFQTIARQVYAVPDYDAVFVSSPIGQVATGFSTELGEQADQQAQLTSDAQAQATTHVSEANSSAEALSTQQQVVSLDSGDGTSALFDSGADPSAYASSALSGIMGARSVSDSNSSGTTTSSSGGVDSGSSTGGIDSADSGTTANPGGQEGGDESGVDPSNDESGDQEVSDESLDPRLSWTPMVLPDGVSFDKSGFGGSIYMDKPFAIQPNGQTSFVNVNTDKDAWQPVPTDPLLGTGQMDRELTTTTTTSQKWNSESDWTVTFSITTILDDKEQSEDSEGEETDISRLLTETLSLTVINGTSAIYSYSISDVFGFGVGSEWGEREADGSIWSISKGNSSLLPQASSNPVDDIPDENAGEVRSSLTMTSSLSSTFAISRITLPDGTLATKYKLGLSTSDTTIFDASGSYGVSHGEGVLKQFGVNAFAGNDSPTSTGDGLLGISEEEDGGPPQEPHEFDEPEEGGEGMAIQADGHFDLHADAGLGFSRNIEAIVPDGQSIDDVTVTGDIGGNVTANANGSIGGSRSIDFQTSTSDDGNPGEQLYLSFGDSSENSGRINFGLGFSSLYTSTPEDEAQSEGEPGATAANGVASGDTGDDTADPPDAPDALGAYVSLSANRRNSSTSDKAISWKDYTYGPASVLYEDFKSEPTSSNTTYGGFDFYFDESEVPRFSINAGFSIDSEDHTKYYRAFDDTANGIVAMQHLTVITDETSAMSAGVIITVGLSGDPTITPEFSLSSYSKIDAVDNRKIGHRETDYTVRWGTHITSEVTVTGNLEDGITTTPKYTKFFWVSTSANSLYESDPETLTHVLDAVQLGLDLVGLVPGLGEGADLISAGISLARGNRAEALLSFAAMMPFVGAGATVAKLAGRGGKVVVKQLDKVDEVLDGASTAFKKCTDAVNCFVVGTQVLVAVEEPAAAPRLATVDTEDAALIDQLFESPDATLDLDRYAAAGAFLLAAGLSLRRHRQSQPDRRKRQLLPTGT